jgi:hypothetical protein
MTDVCYVVGVVASLAAILLILDYRDHAKAKREQKKKAHESTFFKDEPKN